MAVAMYDAKLAKYQQESRMNSYQQQATYYNGPKIKWEETGFYKAMVKAGNIEQELTKLRDLFKKRADPTYEPDDDDFNVNPVRQFDAKSNYYNTLEVDEYCSLKDVKQAYKKLALKYHPDKNREKTPKELLKMQEEFEKIQIAYEILSDRATRRQYDRKRFDEERAKQQGMGWGGGDKKSDGRNQSSSWARWAGDQGLNSKPVKLDNTPDKRHEVRISLNKVFNGGLKIVSVARMRIQKHGSCFKSEKTYHLSIEPGQPDGSEERLEAEGDWKSLSNHAGDLVFVFKHKPHDYLRAVGGEDGDAETITRIVVKAGPLDPVLVAWTPTFKRRMLLVRFRNPFLLPSLPPCREVCLDIRIPGEGLPGYRGDGVERQRGALIMRIKVRWSGPMPLPTSLGRSHRAVFLNRWQRSFDRSRQLHIELGLTSRRFNINQYAESKPWAPKNSVAEHGECSRGLALPAVAIVWQASSDLDLVQFAKFAGSLGHWAEHAPAHFTWGYHRDLTYLSLPYLDIESHSPAPSAMTRAPRNESSSASTSPEVKETKVQDAKAEQAKVEASGDQEGDEGGGMFDFDELDRLEGMFDFDELDKLEGLADGHGETKPDEDAKTTQLATESVSIKADTQSQAAAKDAPTNADPQSTESDTFQRMFGGSENNSTQEEESQEQDHRKQEQLLQELLQPNDEEHELETLIRSKQIELRQVQQQWEWKKRRIQRDLEEGEEDLKQLLEFDKAREIERIEKAMASRQQSFGYQLETEQRWKDEFHFRNEWIVVFKPKIVKREKPSQNAALVEGVKEGTVVKAVDKPNDEGWLQLEDGFYVLTKHSVHGTLLKKYFGNASTQNRWDELEAKIAKRRQSRNDEFLALKEELAEVNKWTIPPGPSREELLEMEDEEGERLHAELAPLLAELQEAKKKLKALQQHRLDKARSLSGDKKGAAYLEEGPLPEGLNSLEKRSENNSQSQQPVSIPPPVQMQLDLPAWETKKQAADAAFKRQEWNTALSLYSQALEAGGESLDSKKKAVLFANRSVTNGKLGEWSLALEDAKNSCTSSQDWPRSWLRRAIAEMHLGAPVKAIESVREGLKCGGKDAVQFLPLVLELEAAIYDGGQIEPGLPKNAEGRAAFFRDLGTKAFEANEPGVAVLEYTRALFHRRVVEPMAVARILSNRAAAFLTLGLANQAREDSLEAAPLDLSWPKPLNRAGQASLLLEDLKSAYQNFAKARRIDKGSTVANDGVSDCLHRLLRWEGPQCARRWQNFSADRGLKREDVRIWTVSDVFFDQHGSPEWVKSLPTSFFGNDICMVTGNMADSLAKLRFGLTVLKSKFRRLFFVPGNHDLWVRPQSLMDLMNGSRINEQKDFGDSISKYLEVLQACHDLGVETAPAEVATGVFIVPLMSWPNRDFVSHKRRKELATKSDQNATVNLDSWAVWPFDGGPDDAWKYLMRMNEAPLRAVLCAKSQYERLGEKAQIITMSHFLPRNELRFDWTVPGIWDHIGCSGIEDQIRAIGSKLHVYGRSCVPTQKMIEDVWYVHNPIGMPDQHRPGMAPLCVYEGGKMMPDSQPKPANGFNFQPQKRPEPASMAGG